MLEVSFTNDKNLLDELSNAIFGETFNKQIGYILLSDNTAIGLAEVDITEERAILKRIGVIPSMRGDGNGDFFTRALLYYLTNVSDTIIIDIPSDYYKPFGFAEKDGKLYIESEKLVFPHKCQH